jgi:hypothetical protein
MSAQKSYYEKNKAKIQANAKKYYQENKERIAEYSREYNKKYYQKNKVKIYQKRRFLNNPKLQQWYKQYYQMKKNNKDLTNIKIYTPEKLYIKISGMGGGNTDNLVTFQ